MEGEDGIKEYRWETGYERTWEAITEDNTGLIEVSVQEMLQRQRRKKLLEKLSFYAEQSRSSLSIVNFLKKCLTLRGCSIQTTYPSKNLGFIRGKNNVHMFDL